MNRYYTRHTDSRSYVKTATYSFYIAICDIYYSKFSSRVSKSPYQNSLSAIISWLRANNRKLRNDY